MDSYSYRTWGWMLFESHITHLFSTSISYSPILRYISIMQPGKSEGGKKNQPEKTLNYWYITRKKLKAVTHSGTLTLVLQILLSLGLSSHTVYNHQNVTVYVKDFQCCFINNFTVISNTWKELLISDTSNFGYFCHSQLSHSCEQYDCLQTGNFFF